MKDKIFLKWIHDRLLNVYKEDINIDFMHKLRAIIYHTSKDKVTTNALSIKQDKEVLSLEE